MAVAALTFLPVLIEVSGWYLMLHTAAWAAQMLDCSRMSGVLRSVASAFSILLALVGVFLITTHGSLTGLAVSPAALASGVVSACCVAIYTMWPKKLQEQYPTPMLQAGRS